MLYKAKFAICSKIHINHINALRPDDTIFSVKTAGTYSSRQAYVRFLLSFMRQWQRYLFSAEEKVLLYSYSQYKDSEFITNISR